VLAVSDSEVGGALKEEGSVGVGSTALAITSSELNAVVARLEGLLLRGLSLKGELDSVLAGGKAGVKLTITEGGGLRGDDGDLELTSGSLVEDSEEDIDFEGGSLRAGGRGNGDLVKASLATIVNGASVKELAEVDGVEVLRELLNEVDKGVDTGGIAKKVADSSLGLLGRVGEGLGAELTASADDAGLKDDVQQLVDTVADEASASTTK